MTKPYRESWNHAHGICDGCGEKRATEPLGLNCRLCTPCICMLGVRPPREDIPTAWERVLRWCDADEEIA